MNYKNILFELRDNQVGWLTLNRPDALNALNSATLLEMKDCLAKVANDEKVRVLVLTGSGDKAFIAGADILEMQNLETGAAVMFARLGQAVSQLIEGMPKPTIAAVNGFALGGGTEMAIACDFIVASEKAVFGQPEVGLGVIPGFGATVRLAKFVGLPRAKELIFSGRKVKASEALEIGLVNHVFPSDKFLSEVESIAANISRQSFSAVSTSKRLLNEFSETIGIQYKLDSEAQSFGHLFGSKDQAEGMKAFTEKRKPNFI